MSAALLQLQELWLRIDGTRDDMFRLSERWSRELAAKAGLGLAPGLIGFWFLRSDWGPAILVAELTYLCCFGAAFMYLGLALTRSFNALDVALFIALVLAAFTVLLQVEKAGPDLFRDGLICLFALAAAAALRGLAHRRWLGIDWTANRISTVLFKAS